MASLARSVRWQDAKPGMGYSPTRPGDGAPMIFAISCGSMTLDLDYFITGETGKIVAPATSFLIDHPSGLAIFDTGFGARVIDGASEALRSIFRAGAEDRINHRLEALGVAPSSIKWVVNSHMHIDHAGGNMWLPDATIVVQASEWDYARAGVDRAYHRSEVETGHKMLLLNGEHDLFGDGTVMVVPTPGHTPGHQSLRVKTATGEAVLTGDCCNLKRSLDEMRFPGHVFSAEQYLASMKCSQAGGGRAPASSSVMTRRSGMRPRKMSRSTCGHRPQFRPQLGESSG